MLKYNKKRGIILMNNTSTSTHKSVQHLSALDRKSTERPNMAKTFDTKSVATPHLTDAAKHAIEEAAISNMKRRQALADKMNRERLAELKAKSPKKVYVSPKTMPKIPSKAQNKPKPLATINEREEAVKSAISSVAQMNTEKDKKLKKESVFTFKKIALALCCSALIVGAIVFAISSSAPNLSFEVAAMQTGFDVSELKYVPRGYAQTSIIAEKGKFSATYTNEEGSEFELTESPSSWDSETLETNYVKTTFQDYSILKEQGLTLCISGSSCAWVNGGKLFTIKTTGNNLTKKQLINIAASL